MEFSVPAFIFPGKNTLGSFIELVYQIRIYREGSMGRIYHIESIPVLIQFLQAFQVCSGAASRLNPELISMDLTLNTEHKDCTVLNRISADQHPVIDIKNCYASRCMSRKGNDLKGSFSQINDVAFNNRNEISVRFLGIVIVRGLGWMHVSSGLSREVAPEQVKFIKLTIAAGMISVCMGDQEFDR